MFRNLKLLILAILSIAALLAGAALLCNWFFQTAGVSETAPEWQLNDVDGNPMKLSDFKGKVVILDFWATWCPPCREEIPGFIALQEKYGDGGLTIIGVSLDKQGPLVVKSFMRRFGMNYPVVMGDEKIFADYGGIEALPTTFIIDRQGNIVTIHETFTE